MSIFRIFDDVTDRERSRRSEQTRNSSGKGLTILRIRKALIGDVKEIQKLVNDFARKEQMIPRSVNELYENVRDFVVAEDKHGIVGACALHVLWDDLAEVRSLAVRKEFQGKGIGRKMVSSCIRDAGRSASKGCLS